MLFGPSFKWNTKAAQQGDQVPEIVVTNCRARTKLNTSAILYMYCFRHKYGTIRGCSSVVELLLPNYPIGCLTLCPHIPNVVNIGTT